jgi:hypothetical protein
VLILPIQEFVIFLSTHDFVLFLSTHDFVLLFLTHKGFLAYFSNTRLGPCKNTFRILAVTFDSNSCFAHSLYYCKGIYEIYKFIFI